MVLNISQKLIDFLSNCPKPLHLHEPEFQGYEMQYVKECIETGWVSSAGPFVERFEADLQRYTQLYATSTVNGTAALQLCYHLAGIQAGDEVFAPTLTFVATINALSYCGAIAHFVASEPQTMAVDPAALREYIEAGSFERADDGLINVQTGRKIKALIVTHIFGHPARMRDLVKLCRDYKLILIEDAAEALGSFYDAKHVGCFGRLAALSFNGNKIITTGGGGAVLTTDIDLARRAKHLSTTARTGDPYCYHHDEIGFNFRMPNINAALGCAQLEKMDYFLEQKRKLGQAYSTLFEGCNEGRFFAEPPDTKSNFWMNTITLLDEETRNIVMDELRAEDIHCRGVWAPMHLLPMYQSCPMADLRQTHSLIKASMNLPSSAFLGRLAG